MYVQISEEAAYSKIFSVVFIEAMLPLASMQDLFICSWTLRWGEQTNKDNPLNAAFRVQQKSANNALQSLGYTHQGNKYQSKFLTVGRSTNQPKFHPYSLE